MTNPSESRGQDKEYEEIRTGVEKVLRRIISDISSKGSVKPDAYEGIVKKRIGDEFDSNGVLFKPIHWILLESAIDYQCGFTYDYVPGGVKSRDTSEIRIKGDVGDKAVDKYLPHIVSRLKSYRMDI